MMIDLGTWHLGDAYYWRAWNRYSLKELDPAWDDVERAISLQRNTSVYTLAGFIAWARQELDTAVDRFDLAFKMDRTNCEAIWSESLVHIDRQAWPSAAPKFSAAMSCFIASAAQARADSAAIEKATYAEALKLKRLAAAEKRVETAEHRKAQSAYNAANIYLRLGEKNPALNHADVAAEHPLLKEKALTLKATIEKIRR
jgi:tetratricopeptide (TPR) repeat protein